MASQADVNGKTFLFTHAGIVESWWKKHFPDTPTDVASICDALNAKMSDMETLGAFIDDALMDITKRRGGESEADLDYRKAFLITPSGEILQFKAHARE